MRYTTNFVLLGLLLITIVSMVLMVIYYYSTYSGLNKRYKSAIVNVEAVATDLNKTLTEVRAKESLLNKKEKELLDYVKELNLSKERETSLGDHFTELRGDKEDLERDLNATSLEKEQWRENYYTAKQDLDVCKVDYKLKVSELDTAKREVLRLDGIGDNLATSSNELSYSVADVNNKIEDIDDNAGRLAELAKEYPDISEEVSNLRSNIKKLEEKMDDLEKIVNTIKILINSM